MTTSYDERLSLLENQVSRVDAVRTVYKSNIDSTTSSVIEDRARADMYAKCSEIFKSWLEKSVEHNINSIAELATAGLKHVISDQDLAFKISQESKLNRVSMKFVLQQADVEGDPLSSFGGGAAVVVSLILRLAVMQRVGCANLLILDESMVALANAYVPDAASFMRRLSEETGIHILMVTHNNEFIANSHVAYEGVKDTSLKLKSVVSTVNM